MGDVVALPWRASVKEVYTLQGDKKNRDRRGETVILGYMITAFERRLMGRKKHFTGALSTQTPSPRAVLVREMTTSCSRCFLIDLRRLKFWSRPAALGWCAEDHSRT